MYAKYLMEYTVSNIININKVRLPFFLFDYSSQLLMSKPENYYSRFNYAACELWLCTEICHAINHEGQGLQLVSQGDLFLYNEDYKRDLTLYSSGRALTPKIETHIEVKVVYPVSKGKCLESMDSLFNKLASSFNFGHQLEGWVYLVWTQHYNLTADEFFDSRISWIQEDIKLKGEQYEQSNKKSPYFSELKTITEGILKWRGMDKIIIVKAIAFSFR